MQTKAKYGEFEIQGHFGCPEYKVKIGKNLQGQYFLLNFFHSSQKNQLQELNPFVNFDHPSILKIIQIINEGDYIKKNRNLIKRSCVIYEYPKGGELYEYLFQTGSFQETQARLYFKQLVEGLIQVHKQGLFHGDLTTENIFFSDAKTIKIGELGLNLIRRKKYIYEAPKWSEENNNYQQSKDIFALGMILFTLMFGKPPFSQAELKNKSFQAFQVSPQVIWDKMQNTFPRVNITDKFKDLVQGMLTELPQNRMSLSEVYYHPWTQINSEFNEEMIREFYSKQKKIEQFIIKVRLSHEIQQKQMIISNNKSQLQKGIGNFRSEQEKCQDELKIEYQQIQNKNLKQISLDLMKSDNYLISVDPSQIMKLIKEKVSENGFNLKIENEQLNYEFSIIISSNLNTTVKIEILKLENNDDIMCVNFSRLKGELLNYIETIKRFHQLIDNILKDLSQDFQGEEQII